MKASYKVLKDARIPIYEKLTLYVSESGNDATGDHTGKPFRQPQAAIDYVVASLDFRKPCSVAISVGPGTFNGIDPVCPIAGMTTMTIAGSGPGYTLLNHVTSHMSNELILQEIGFSGKDPSTSNAQIAVYQGATIIITGSVLFKPQTGAWALLAANGGFVYSQGGTLHILDGSFAGLFMAQEGGRICMGGCTGHVGGSVNATTAVVVAQSLGQLTMRSCVWTLLMNGAKFIAKSGGVILTEDGDVPIPGTSPGVIQTGGQVI